MQVLEDTTVLEAMGDDAAGELEDGRWATETARKAPSGY